MGIVSTTTGNTLFTATRGTAGFGNAAMPLNFGAIPGVVGAFFLQCLLPPEEPSNGFSYVLSYTVNDSH